MRARRGGTYGGHMGTTQGQRLGYREELAGLRGVAILVVVLAHGFHPVVAGGGIIGVRMFFVLSGFLITHLLLDEHARTGRVSLPDFYRRRVRRLLPALGAYLAIYLAVTVVAYPADDAGPRVAGGIVSATYMANWARVAGWELYELGHTWSLAVEEQFYLLWPLMLLGLLRWVPDRYRRWIVAAAIIGLAGWRSWLFEHGASWRRIYDSTDLVAVSLLSGCWLAMLRREGRLNPARWQRYEALAAAVIVAGLVTFNQHTGAGIQTLLAHVGFNAIAVATVVVIASTFDPASQLGRWMRVGWLQWLGKVSYALYLWHLLLLKWGAQLWPDVPKAVRSVPIIILALLVSELSWRMIERPFLASTRQPPRAEKPPVAAVARTSF